jgi:hypothetical protein
MDKFSLAENFCWIIDMIMTSKDSTTTADASAYDHHNQQVIYLINSFWSNVGLGKDQCMHA